MVLQKIYTTFQGEVNIYGIGAPAIFLRLAGCHLRCYLTTTGELCDTPEALDRAGMTETPVQDIVAQVLDTAKQTGIKVVTLTGGDPLWNKPNEITELLLGLTHAGLFVSIETSGTLDWRPYRMPGVFWVLDYKLASCGLKHPSDLFRSSDHVADLTERDYIKFVVKDDADFAEMVKAIAQLKQLECRAVLAVGVYWGAMQTFELFNKLKDAGLLGEVVLNMQTHKMAIASNYTVTIPQDI